MIPITVRLANSVADRHVTNLISGCQWRSVAPGGYASAEFTLHRPITMNDPLLSAFTKVYIYDGRNGSTLFEGRLAMPGRAAGDSGQVWSITASGPAAHAMDDSRSLIYVDRDLTSMFRNNSTPAAEAGVNTDPGNAAQEDALVFRFPNGITLNTGSNIAMTYDRIAQAGMLFGGISYTWDAGFTNGAFEVQAVFTPTTTVIADPISTAGGARAGLSAGGTIGTDHTLVTLRMIRVTGGAISISGDATWASMANLIMRGQLVTKTGAPITGAGTYGNGFVYAHEIVADLLGRMLPDFDGANASIATTAVPIDQLAYADPATADDVLADLMKIEAAYYWAAWETNPTTGKYRFEWKPWPVSPRYEATVADGFDSPSPTFELYNKALVRWKDGRGRIRLGEVTLDVPELTKAGITRTGYLDVSDEIGSANNAIAAGTAFLQDHNRAPSNGSVKLYRPVRDMRTGRIVMPWEVLPGELIRLHGVEASIDLTANSLDGMTVFRIVSNSSSSDGTADLELDMFTRTETRALADLLRRRRRKR